MAAVKAHSVFQTAMQKFLDLRASSNDAAESKPALVNKVFASAQSLQPASLMQWQLATIILSYSIPSQAGMLIGTWFDEGFTERVTFQIQLSGLTDQRLRTDSHLQVTQYIAAAAFPTNAAKAVEHLERLREQKDNNIFKSLTGLCQANVSQEEAVKLSKVAFEYSTLALLTAEDKSEFCSITFPPQALFPEPGSVHCLPQAKLAC